MKPKIELTLPELEIVKARLQRRKTLYKPPSRSRKMRTYGIDGVFTKEDLVGVYDITERRIYYILGRGRAERIIDSLFCQGHELLQFEDAEENTKYFNNIESGSQKYKGHELYWEPCSQFQDIFLCGALKVEPQKDGTYLIGRREFMRPHPCENCRAETIAESVMDCPRLNYALKLEGCVKLYNMSPGKAWRIVEQYKKEPKEKE